MASKKKKKVKVVGRLSAEDFQIVKGKTKTKMTFGHAKTLFEGLARDPVVAYVYFPEVDKLAGAVQQFGEVVLELGIRSKINLKRLVKRAKNFEVDPELEYEFDDYDFYKITLAAAFTPPTNMRITKAIVRIELENKRQEPPKVYSIEPQNINQKSSVTKTYGVNGGLKLEEIGVGIEGKHISVETFPRLHPRIIGRTSHRSWAEWELRTNKIQNYIDGFQQFNLIIKQPKRSRTNGKLIPDEVNINWLNVKGVFSRLGVIGQKKIESFKEFSVP